MKAIGVAVAVVVAAGVGALAGATLFGGSKDPALTPEAVDSRVLTEVRRAEAARDEVAAVLKRDKEAAAARAVKAEKELAEVRKERDDAKSSLAAAAAASAAAASASAAAKKGEGRPVQAFSFPDYDEALSKVDWKSVGTTTRQMLPVLEGLRKSSMNGGKLDLAAAGRTQQLNGALIHEASKINEALPGTGVNGAYTHPSFMANAIAATLEDAGKPLTDTQSEALGKLGRDFSDREKLRAQGYDEHALGLQKVLDEAALKDQFFEGASAILTPEQRDLLWPAATRGLVGWDLFSSGLLLAQLIRPLVVKDRDAFAADVGKQLAAVAKAGPDRKEAVHAAAAAWAAELPEAWFEKDTETLSGMQPIMAVAFVEELGKREVPLLQKVAGDLGLPEESAKAVRGLPVVFFPWVKKGP